MCKFLIVLQDTSYRGVSITCLHCVLAWCYGIQPTWSRLTRPPVPFVQPTHNQTPAASGFYPCGCCASDPHYPPWRLHCHTHSIHSTVNRLRLLSLESGLDGEKLPHPNLDLLTINRRSSLDRSYTTSYQSATVSIAQSCTTFEIFDLEECYDLQI